MCLHPIFALYDRALQIVGFLRKSMEDLLSFGVLKWDEISELDKIFHLSLARITGNKIYESVLFTVYDNIKQYFGRFIAKDIQIFKNILADITNLTDCNIIETIFKAFRKDIV